jgi:signal transduction histidine kinase
LQEKNRQLELSSRTERERLFEAVNQQREQLRALANRLTEIQEAERKELARDLHDHLGQMLTAISINLTAIKDELPSDCAPRVRERLAEANLLTAQILEQVRELSLNLRPPMLDDLGLTPTLRWYVKQYAKRLNIETIFEAPGLEERLSPELETTLYRVVQEALNNVAKHAQASRVQLRLERKGGAIVACIEDNGQGFDVSKVIGRKGTPNGTGLLGMRERINLLGGRLDIQSRPGHGVRLLVEVPEENGYAQDKNITG